MAVGAVLAFPGTAQGAVGDLVIVNPASMMLGTIPVTFSATGSGTVSGATWTGAFSGTGFVGCTDNSVTTPAAGDVITVDLADTGTQTMTGMTLVLDTTSCAVPPQADCRLTLQGNRVLKTVPGGFPVTDPFPSPVRRSGTFTAAPGATVGSYTISEESTGDCLSSGLAVQIAAALGAPAGQPSSLPYSNSSTRAFTASLTKTLEVA